MDRVEVIYCEDDGEFRLYCDICNKLCIERFYKNHLKSQTHINIIHKRQQLNNLIKINSHIIVLIL